MNRELILAVLYDLALTTGSEVESRPLLEKTLSRLMFHTGFPVGVVIEIAKRSGDEFEVRLLAAHGNFLLGQQTGSMLRLPSALLTGPAELLEAADLSALSKAAHYSHCLRLPVNEAIFFLLLSSRTPKNVLPLVDIFQPVMANLAKAVSLCRESEERFRSVVEAIPYAIVLHRGGRLVFVNPAAVSMFGASSVHELIDRPLMELVHPDSQHIGTKRSRNCTEQGIAAALVEDRYVKLDGTVFDVEVEDRPIVMEGSPTVISTLRDITERKQNIELSAALIATEKSNAAKSQFLSNMSHEIRTPLNAIIGFSTLLLESELLPRQRDHVQKVNDAGEILLNTINDILDLSKIEAGQLRIELIPFIVATTLATSIEMVRQKAADKGLQLRASIAADIAPCLTGDPFRLGQVILNLLSNAVKFTERGEVTLEAALLKEEDCRQQLTVTIRDTGIGIQSEQIATLFQPFTQADESTTRRFGGTGLGLSICKQIVERMGGEIRCESTPGLGSVFSFTAWFGIGDPASIIPTHAAATSAAAYNFSDYHILLVEDNEVNQQLVRELLKDTGVEVSVASHGLEAVSMITEGSREYDLVLMDIQMPVMDGYEATRLIRADSRFATMPIIAMTAHAMQEEQQKILKSGMDAHIPKPIDVHTLLRVMRLFLGEPTVDMPLLNTHAKSDGNVAEIAVIEGFDVAAALDRPDGNVALYNRLLRSFVDNKAKTVKIIDEALQSGDTALAERTAHTLKSSAGTIGAVELESLAQNLENAIGREESGEIVTAALRHFAIEMERVVTVLSNTLPPAAPVRDNSLSPCPVDGASVTPALQSLLLSIRGSDCAVEQYLDDHQNELKSLPKQDMDILGKHLKNFDFAAAHEALLALAEKHGIELEPGTP